MHRALGAQDERGHQVVGAARGEAREHIGCRGGDEDEVGLGGELDVQLSRGRRIPHRLVRDVSRDGREGHPTDEARPGVGQDGDDPGPGLDEEPREGALLNAAMLPVTARAMVRPARGSSRALT